jgi:hypothetical protein
MLVLFTFVTILIVGVLLERMGDRKCKGKDASLVGQSSLSAFSLQIMGRVVLSDNERPKCVAAG